MANYTFSTYTASNGVILKVIKTAASNIVLKYIGTRLNASTQTSFGINGGFFDSNLNCLNITVNNDTEVHNYGLSNAKYARGTLLYDAYINHASVKVASSKSDLGYVRPDMYWAQGGISMKLGDDAGWRDQAVTKENMPNPDGVAGRAGMVYDSSNNVYLIVCANKSSAGVTIGTTAPLFRQAIKEKISSAVDGIFLDGSGSAQMKCTEFTENGDGRSVASMIALRSI